MIFSSYRRFLNEKIEERMEIMLDSIEKREILVGREYHPFSLPFSDYLIDELSNFINWMPPHNDFTFYENMPNSKTQEKAYVSM